MVTAGLIEVQATTVVKSAMKEETQAPRGPHEKKESKAKQMRIYMGEADRWNGEPLHDAIIKRLRMLEVSGATVYRGILGYGAKGHTHKESFLHISRDLPVMVALIDTEDKIREAMDMVESMMEDGLIVTSDVDVIRLVRSPLPD